MEIFLKPSTRKEVIETLLGGTKGLEFGVRRVDADSLFPIEGMYQLMWQRSPEEHKELPLLVVLPNEEVEAVLAMAAASPISVSPITSVCRILSRAELKAAMGAERLYAPDMVLPAIVATAMAEAILHSEGRINQRGLSPALCARTLACAWARALVSQTPVESIQALPFRWLDTYSIINSRRVPESAEQIASAVLAPLGVLTQLSADSAPESPAGEIARAIVSGDGILLENAWRDISSGLPFSIGLGEFEELTREERGSYLQRALQGATSGRLFERATTHDRNLIACAFLATRVAPGSLEHLELLNKFGRRELPLWYAMFAALSRPSALMIAQNGLGVRVLRDVTRWSSWTARPEADIAYSELAVLERSGLEAVARKCGHLGEIEVELIPFVVSSFSYPGRNSRARDAGAEQIALDIVGEPPQSAKKRMSDAIAILAELVRTLPEESPHDRYPSTKRPRKR